MRFVTSVAVAMTVLAAGFLPRPGYAQAEPLPKAEPARYLSGETSFPGESWQQLADPAAAGWNVEGLTAAKERFDELESAALVAVHRGVVVASWGTTAEKYTAQSVRKSLLNSLLGIEVDGGRLSLEASLADLGIDDDPPLTATEKQATLRQLLQSRSGIYRSAIYEHGSWKRRKPERGTHAPGEHWFYNNWGFNALESIYQDRTGQAIGETFRDRIAEPLQMQDFRPQDVVVLTRDSVTEKALGNDSRHAAHIFQISTRDLARFGLLYLKKGRWLDQQLVSSEWIDRTLEGLPTGGRPGETYGFLWWIFTDEDPYWPDDVTPVYAAQGARGHWLAIVPALDLVVAHQVATGGLDLASQLKRRTAGSPSVSDAEIGELITLIARAAPRD